mgnify:CR=1 FL=1
MKVHYTSLPDFIRSLGDTPVFGTFLDGKNMYEQPLSANGLIVMGNEGNGIGKEVEALINRKLISPIIHKERNLGISQRSYRYRSNLCRVPATGCMEVKSKG